MLATCRDVKLEYKVLKEKVKEINKKDAQFYGNMFAKLNKLEPFDTEARFSSSLLLILLEKIVIQLCTSITNGFLIL